MGDDDEHDEHARKGSGKGKAKNGGAVFSEKIVSFFFVLSYCLLMICLRNVVFFSELDTEHMY
jgi:hypothetical protein